MMQSAPFIPEEASTVAGSVDALYFYLVGIAAFFSLLIAGLIVYFAIRYRRRSASEVPHGKEPDGLKLELLWTIIPFIITMTIFVWGASVYFTIYRPPTEGLDIYVVAKQWMWRFQHADGQREINDLHVPVGQRIRLTMASEDVIHSFYVPAFRIKYDVVPGRYTYGWFEATKPGRYHLFCAEYCGTNHALMGGWVVVMEPADYQAWLAGGASGGSLSASGEKLFQQLACVTCHRADAQGRGPVLTGLFGKPVTLSTGQALTADEAYLRESIVNPNAKIVAGYAQPSIMPTFQGQVSEEQLLQIIAYIKSLTPQPVREISNPTEAPASQRTPPGDSRNIPAPKGQDTNTRKH